MGHHGQNRLKRLVWASQVVSKRLREKSFFEFSKTPNGQRPAPPHARLGSVLYPCSSWSALVLGV